ncbi:MAG: lactonase family protein [Mariniblastus sp.]|nr:lactonase family protein [Mariniblastus sp.]
MNRSPYAAGRCRFFAQRAVVTLPAILMLLCLSPMVMKTTAQQVDLWIGSSKAGIYHMTLDTSKGELSQPVLASNIKGAGFLALHPNGKVLYATSRENSGEVTAFAITQKAAEKTSPSQPTAGHSKQLKQLGTLSTNDGGAACIAVDQTGTVLMSAQYGGGSITTYRLNQAGDLDHRVQTVEHGQGSGIYKQRQETAHPHWVGTSPDNRFLMVPDLGMDQVVVYEMEPGTGRVKLKSKVAVPPGSGPRHMKFHPSGNYVFVLNELTLTISVFKYDPATGTLDDRYEIETLPDRLKDKHMNSAAEIRVHPSGRFVYTSNRGHDSISVFSFDPENGKLELVERESIRGSCPRNFNIDPTGKWLIAAGQHSNTLALFEIDQETGELVFARQVANATAPRCVLFPSETLPGG